MDRMTTFPVSGRALAVLRGTARRTQSEVAHAAGLSVGFYGQCEKGTGAEGRVKQLSREHFLDAAATLALDARFDQDERLVWVIAHFDADLDRFQLVQEQPGRDVAPTDVPIFERAANAEFAAAALRNEGMTDAYAIPAWLGFVLDDLAMRGLGADRFYDVERRGENAVLESLLPLKYGFANDPISRRQSVRELSR